MAGPSNPAGRTALVQRERSLPADPSSPRLARALVREVVGHAGRSDWADPGELAVSEIVTNASLHAHTPIDLRIAVYDDQLCVEVRDFNPVLPVQRNYEDEATTGRGMGLVAALASACGVHTLGSEGKIVWFCLGAEPAGADADALLEAWDIDSWDADVPAGCVDVVLRGMPATLWLSARQHHDAILRELVLYLAEHDGTDVDLDVTSADWARGAISTQVVAAVHAAQAAGTARPPVPGGHQSPLPWVPEDLDLVISVPPDAAEAFAALQDVLDHAESLAVAGELFARPGLPEIIAVRDWASEQVIAQLGGAPPSAWPGAAQPRFEIAVHDRTAGRPPEWDVSSVTEATSAVVAADDANRIIAVSPSLGELTGWHPDDLVGRRVVTLIPPALREAHVAGFSRHVSTGEMQVIGVPLDLPVLRKDGTEIRCRLLIDRVDAVGRYVYLARIEPT